MKQNYQSTACEKVRRAVSRVGDRWSALALLALLDQPLRFNELLRALEGVSQRMLTFTLRNLERDGLIGRCAANGDSRRFRYELTEAGRSLCVILQAFREWGERHFEALTAAR